MTGLVRRFDFEAAHRLPHHPGKCRELHGHSYRLVVRVEGPVDAASGMVQDFADLKAAVRREVLDQVDHRCLNELLDNPTAELLAAWIWQRLAPAVAGLAEIELFETRDCSVVYRGG
ncbi:MAG TPA: 6-carboxytetrahydropterin synthase QueD [Candidatus Polarisedimenticolaceae bacterium]|nr:6-carboxytetrahydropterin synthase QueD [Candidatus Polarisedimenticolaceae bacterium]